MVCNGKTNRPSSKGLLVPLPKKIEKLNKISIKNWQTVIACYACDNDGFSLLKSAQQKVIRSIFGDMLETKATKFCY